MPGRQRHIFIVSDATGHTCELVVKAALTQFDTSKAILHKVQYVRDIKQVKEVVEEACHRHAQRLDLFELFSGKTLPRY